MEWKGKLQKLDPNRFYDFRKNIAMPASDGYYAWLNKIPMNIANAYWLMDFIEKKVLEDKKYLEKPIGRLLLEGNLSQNEEKNISYKEYIQLSSTYLMSLEIGNAIDFWIDLFLTYVQKCPKILMRNESITAKPDEEIRLMIVSEMINEFVLLRSQM